MVFCLESFPETQSRKVNLVVVTHFGLSLGRHGRRISFRKWIYPTSFSTKREKRWFETRIIFEEDT